MKTLALFVALLIPTALVPTFAEASNCEPPTIPDYCEVGNLQQGRWEIVAGPGPAVPCLIPGPPHPDSPYLQENPRSSAFRLGYLATPVELNGIMISGPIKITSVVAVACEQIQIHQGECPGDDCSCDKTICIQGFLEFFCAENKNYTDYSRGEENSSEYSDGCCQMTIKNIYRPDIPPLIRHQCVQELLSIYRWVCY